MDLEKELQYFETIKSELLKHHLDQFALIKDEVLLGTFTKMEEAYEEGVNRYGNEPFLIKRIAENESPESLPSLMSGVIRADL